MECFASIDFPIFFILYCYYLFRFEKVVFLDYYNVVTSKELLELLFQVLKLTVLKHSSATLSRQLFLQCGDMCVSYASSSCSFSTGLMALKVAA